VWQAFMHRLAAQRQNGKLSNSLADLQGTLHIACNDVFLLREWRQAQWPSLHWLWMGALGWMEDSATAWQACYRTVATV
jgi:hypothetical protein